ncbi:MAG: peroxiredoxin [Deltaproteobacteria bacterium]|nr:peroxiredoxin [Deltaproteobacteria bacterium]
MSKLSVGDRAPEFSLKDANGKTVKLADFRDKSAVVLYFYPKDDTPGCTAESCMFRDMYEDFVTAGAEVIGVSSDDAASHRSFAEKHQLPFTLLADTSAQTQKDYGVRSVFGLVPGRVTYVIDRHGVIRHVFSSMFNATQHVTEAIQIIKSLQAS